MAEQHDPDNEMLGAEPDEKAGDKAEEAKVKIKAAPKRAKAEEKATLKVEKALAEAREALTAALAKAEQERQARIKAEKALTEAQQALAATHSKLEQERQARVKAEKGRADAETALAEASMTTRGLVENMETPSKVLGEEGTELRVSFIVRLTVDERGEPRRTEIEHTQTRKKESFPALDGERLATFMRSSISAVAIAGPAISEALPSVQVGIPTPEPPWQTSGLTVSDVRVFRKGVPGTLALTLSPQEVFVVQARFQPQRAEAVSPSAQEFAYEMMVYANKVASSESKLLTTFSGSLVKDVPEHTVQTEVPGLSPGIYHLVTLVTLRTPIKAAGYHEGPIVQVS